MAIILKSLLLFLSLACFRSQASCQENALHSEFMGLLAWSTIHPAIFPHVSRKSKPWCLTGVQGQLLGQDNPWALLHACLHLTKNARETGTRLLSALHPRDSCAPPPWCLFGFGYGFHSSSQEFDSEIHPRAGGRPGRLGKTI